MTTALVLIATGNMYHQYAQQLIASAKQYFVPHEVCLFTDSKEDFGVCKVKCPPLGFPEATLKRYHLFLTQEQALSKFDYVFYCDVDALFVGSVGGEIFANGITATLHHNQNPHDLLEERPESEAYLKTVKEYYCGGFNGGTSASFLEMSRAIRVSVDKDSENGLTARWHDESHLNKYLASHPPAKVLTSDYCFPEPELASYKGFPKILCLEKGLGARTVSG